jgi:predicted RNA-binding protein with PUA-like domain
MSPQATPMKHFWLVKSEPSAYSFEQLQKDGRTVWDGVRNFQARNNLKAMRGGDEVLYYHSNEGLAVVGVAKVTREAFPDPKDAQWVAVELAPAKALAKPVTLAAIKKDAVLKEMVFAKQGRLSVSPVTKAEFDRVLKLGA